LEKTGVKKRTPILEKKKKQGRGRKKGEKKDMIGFVSKTHHGAKKRPSMGKAKEKAKNVSRKWNEKEENMREGQAGEW